MFLRSTYEQWVRIEVPDAVEELTHGCRSMLDISGRPDSWYVDTQCIEICRRVAVELEVRSRDVSQ